MSCITKLLEMKGDNAILPINSQCVIEGGGTYKGYEYLIIFTRRGTRCGYVALKPEETEQFNFERKEEKYYYPDLVCHGGITFYGADHGAKDLLPIPCHDSWVGFDCAHANDGRDVELATNYFCEEVIPDELFEIFQRFCLDGKVIPRTYKYVEYECKSIIEQLLGKKWIREHNIKQ